MSGFGPKSQSHPAVSARTSGSASGRQEASAGGSSSTNRSYATWLTCIFNVWVSREAGRGTSPRTRGERPSTKVPAERIAEEVEGEDRGENGDAGADAHPPLEIGQIPLGVVHVLAPGRVRRLRTEAEEGERGF